MASAKKKTPEAEKPEVAVVPGVVETMPGLPGPAVAIDVALDSLEPTLEPVITAPYSGAPLEEATELATATQARFAALPDADKAKLSELGATLVEALSAKTPSTLHHPELAPKAGTRRYRVWPHGELHRDNVVHKPGDTLELPTHVGDAIVCLEPAD